MTDTTQKEINKELFDHAKIANEEMAVIKTDVSWIKRIIERHEMLLWSILGTILIGIGIQIALFIAKK